MSAQDAYNLALKETGKDRISSNPEHQAAPDASAQGTNNRVPDEIGVGGQVNDTAQNTEQNRQRKPEPEGTDNNNRTESNTNRKSPLDEQQQSVYDTARANGLTASQAYALATGKNPLILPQGAGTYADVGGHHVLAQAGFRGDPNYNSSAAFCLSESLMQAEGINHNNNSKPPSVTLSQWALFNELATSGVPNTMAEHQRIAQTALIMGGSSRGFAIDMANYAVVDMYAHGVVSPTRIPWN